MHGWDVLTTCTQVHPTETQGACLLRIWSPRQAFYSKSGTVIPKRVPCHVAPCQDLSQALTTQIYCYFDYW
jgi:hypothetical protein